MGELLSVSEAEGEQLEAFGFFEPFPFSLLVALAATFSINGDSFWVFIYSLYVFFTISISSSHIFSRLCMLMNSLLPWKL